MERSKEKKQNYECEKLVYMIDIVNTNSHSFQQELGKGILCTTE
jgi:hypothetical protein